MTTFKVFGAELAVLAETLSYDYKTICCYDVWTEKSNRLERDCVEVCVHPSVPEKIKQIKNHQVLKVFVPAKTVGFSFLLMSSQPPVDQGQSEKVAPL